MCESIKQRILQLSNSSSSRISSGGSDNSNSSSCSCCCSSRSSMQKALRKYKTCERESPVFFSSYMK